MSLWDLEVEAVVVVVVLLLVVVVVAALWRAHKPSLPSDNLPARARPFQ